MKKKHCRITHSELLYWISTPHSTYIICTIQLHFACLFACHNFKISRFGLKANGSERVLGTREKEAGGWWWSLVFFRVESSCFALLLLRFLRRTLFAAQERVFGLFLCVRCGVTGEEKGRGSLAEKRMAMVVTGGGMMHSLLDCGSFPTPSPQYHVSLVAVFSSLPAYSSSSRFGGGSQPLFLRCQAPGAYKLDCSTRLNPILVSASSTQRLRSHLFC